MKTNNYSAISSGIIGLSIIIGSWIFVSNQPESIIVDTSVPTVASSSNPNEYGPILSIAEAADYLNLSENDVQNIIASEQKKLNDNGTFPGTMFPYFKIGEVIYVSKEGLAVWLADTIEQKRQYLNGTVLQ
ncbi:MULTISPECIES: helix-turn-helix domain-containing protein [Paenibacillus]|uniref:helix-turn-helix domain-containing protein n=1 Tax=Paenibacillus TaxID=44249 RepID=UPI001F18CC6C|nr:helix-turn-helix domain-containing protein [Paenibacillus sp. JJ-223]CAH1207426.1 hypothetical protein PAECIP111890_03018 [Paenibacillus sp. JJ-223]